MLRPRFPHESLAPMIDPFRMMSDMMKAGRMLSETLDAANAVVAKRGETIAAAANDPLRADHRELALMVTEKGHAFAKSGATLAGDWLSLQSDLMRQSQAIGSILMSGRVPTFAVAGAIIDRSARINQRSLSSSIRALKPIHAAATANQRRLKKR